MKNERIEIPLSKGKLGLLILTSFLFLAASVWIIGEPSSFHDTEIIGIIGIIFFGFAGIVLIRKFLSSEMGLVIDSTGIFDNSSGVSVGHIAWENITEIQKLEIEKQKHLIIIVNDPEKYLDKIKNPILRKTAKLNHKLFGSPVTISPNSLKCSFNKLYDIVQEQYEKYGQYSKY